MKKTPLNCFLQTRQEIDHCSDIVKQEGIPSGLDCKNWDVFKIAPYLQDGNLLDMGSDGSVILQNAVKLGLQGSKYGIDLAYSENHSQGEIGFLKGDLMNVPSLDAEFDQITCLSVIEHQVDYNLLAKECARLLIRGGDLYITCDYWDPKPDTSKMKLYSLDWNVLDKQDVLRLVEALSSHGLKLFGEIDWTTQEAVINPTYCSPADVAYTFGVFHFVKL